jgi:hypothetical protein
MQAAPPQTNKQWAKDVTPEMAKRVEKCIDSVLLWCPPGFRYSYDQGEVVSMGDYYHTDEERPFNVNDFVVDPKCFDSSTD